MPKPATNPKLTASLQSAKAMNVESLTVRAAIFAGVALVKREKLSLIKSPWRVRIARERNGSEAQEIRDTRHSTIVTVELVKRNVFDDIDCPPPHRPQRNRKRQAARSGGVNPLI